MTLNIDIGDGTDALTINQLRDALDGTYWTDGWDPTTGSGDYEVDISSGEGSYDGSTVETGSTETVDFDGDVDSDDPRKAIVYVNEDENVETEVGDAVAAAPDGETRFRTWDPAPPADVDGVVVAEVWLGADASEVVSDDIRDRRVGNKAVEAVERGPITQTDEVLEFDEDEVSVSNNGTFISSGSILLQSPDNVSKKLPDTSTGRSRGIKIEVKNEFDDLQLELGPDTDLSETDFELRWLEEDGTSIQTQDVNGDYSQTLELDTTPTVDDTYRLELATKDDSEVDMDTDTDPVFSDADYDGVYINVVGGSDEGGDNAFWGCFEELTVPDIDPEYDGSAIITWDSPNDIISWDLATYQATEDGETVTVNVLDGDGDDELGDIQRNTDISSIDTSENIQIEVELERDDADNNPTFDYVARRYER